MLFSILVLAAVTAVLSPEFVVDLKEAYPALSPDGATLLFQTNRSGRWAIHTARADGKDSKALIDSGDDPVTPSWSADGQRIAYAASVDGQSEIFVADSHGGNRQRLTRDPGDDSHPHWSQDGRIFFNSARTTPDRAAAWPQQWQEIFSMKPDGSDLRQHTHCRTVCTFPVPSPDGTRIAYRKIIDEPGRDWAQNPINRNSEVFVARLDGSDERNLSQTPHFDGWPTWSPDGNWIAFALARDGVPFEGQIYAVKPDGTGIQRLTTDTWSNAQPFLTSDGRSLFTYRSRETKDSEWGLIARTPIKL